MSATLGDKATVSIGGGDLAEVAVRVAEVPEVLVCALNRVRWNT
jgi:hypothetical protein